jgi:hypothetical protein
MTFTGWPAVDSRWRRIAVAVNPVKGGPLWKSNVQLAGGVKPDGGTVIEEFISRNRSITAWSGSNVVIFDFFAGIL